MSGDSYYRTNSNNSSGGGGDNSRNSTDDSIALSAGKLLVGAASVTAAAAGALLAGVIKGGAALTRAGIKAYKKRKEANAAAENELLKRAKAAAESRKTAEREVAERYKQQIRKTSVRKVPGQQATEFVRSAEERRQIADREAELLDRQLTERLAALEKDVSAQCTVRAAHQYEQVIGEWKSRREAISKQEIAEIDKRLKEVHRSMTASFNRLQQKQEIRELAEQALIDAGCIVENLIEMPGAVSFSQKECSLLLQKLRKASQFLESGNYELSFAESCDCVLQSREVYVDTLDKYEASRRHAGELLIDLTALSEAADTIEVSFVHKGEELVDDLYRFCPFWFNAVREEVTLIFPMIHDGMTDAELTDVQQMIRQARNDYLTVYRHAWDKLLSSYNINDVANNSVSLLHSQGYQVESFGYESNSDSGGEEGEPLHINFVNPLTNDKITLVVDSDRNNSVKASLHQFGTSDSSLPDEDKQRCLMNLISEGIGSATGKKVSVTCTSPHRNSQEHEQADIQAQRKKSG
ncbi:MAG: hypothetical protein II059_00275 [Clostridia bacterium]|nr:hypothetical protein [Clostridia bacterium]